MLGNDHENKVENPNDVPAEDQANKTRNDFTFRKTGNETANSRGNGNDRKDNAYDVA